MGETPAPEQTATSESEKEREYLARLARATVRLGELTIELDLAYNEIENLRDELLQAQRERDDH